MSGFNDTQEIPSFILSKVSFIDFLRRLKKT